MAKKTDAPPTHILYESSSGYAVFEVKLFDEIAFKTADGVKSLDDYKKFSKVVNLVSFAPFKSAAHALENANDVSEGILSDHLRSLLELVLTKTSKGNPIRLGLADFSLASAVKSELGIECCTPEQAQNLIRAIRLHFEKLVTGFQQGDVIKAQLGLGHSYSRAKIKFNVNRSDNMIIQAIALLDQLDKDVNTFAMRVREWYGYHFPELFGIVPENHLYSKVVKFIGDRSSLAESIAEGGQEPKLDELTTLLEDDELRAKNVLDASRTSMGSELSEVDMINISMFAERVISLTDYRKNLTSYLTEKMNLVAPSLTALIGERIGARLISHAGSLTNLSKYPASTMQILGAEKALFRALKTKGNTPKYGLIYHSSFIGKAGPKFKGRISRFLANKLSIASRIDSFHDHPSAKYGEVLRSQVEERLTFFETGVPPSKNSDAMSKAKQLIAAMDLDEEDGSDDEDKMEISLPPPPVISEKEKKKKRKSEAITMDVDEPSADEPPKKKSKKNKPSPEEVEAVEVAEAEANKKKKKKEKKDKEAKKAEKRKSLGNDVKEDFETVEMQKPKKSKKEKRKSTGVEA